jgi:uncharacterized protein (DUF58 family)
VTPTRRACIVAAVIALGALALPGTVVLGALVLLAVAIAVDTGFARRPVRLSRAVPAIAVIGQPVRLSVQAEGVAEPDAVRVRQPRTPDLRVSPGEADGRIDGTVTALRRGRHELPAVAARRRGPLGLAAWDFRGDGAAALTVYPDVPNARRIARLVRTGRFREEGVLVRGPLGVGTEFESIRDYLPDDDIRQVNWAATARLARPMSNQYRVEADRQLICLLDCGRLMSAPVGARTRLDAAIDAVAALAYVADEVGDRSGVIAFDDTIRRSLTTRRRGADGIVHAIYDLEPQPVDSDYELAVRTVRNTKRALVVVLSDLLDSAAARGLVDAMPLLSRRHAVVVASSTDPDVLAAVRGEPAHEPDAYRATAALDMLDARARAAAALRGAGVQVLEAAPDVLGEACVAAYLRLKDSARL